MKRVVKAVVALALLAGTAVGLYFGSAALAAYAQRPPSGPTFVSADQLNATLRAGRHTPVTGGGAFVSSASIETGDVRSADMIPCP